MPINPPNVVRTPEGYRPIPAVAMLGDCYNVVESLDDLPAPVGGVRTLPAGPTLICGTISLPIGESLLVPSDAVLLGRDADIDGIIGNVDGPLIDTINGIICKDLFLENLSIASIACCIRITSNGLRVSRIETVSRSGVIGLLLDTASVVTVRDGVSRYVGVGILFRGLGQAVTIVNETFFPPVSPTSGVIFEAASNYTAVAFSNCVFNLQLPLNVGINIDLTATINILGIVTNAFLGPGIPLQGLTPANIEVTSQGNVGLRDSLVRGGAAITGNTAQLTPIAVAGTFVRVGSTNPAHPLYVPDTNNERVTLVGATAATQVLEYTGLDNDQPIEAFYSIVIATTFLGGVVTSARLVRIPAGGGSVVIPNTTVEASTAGLLNSTNTLTWSGSFDANPGDGIAIEVTNVTNTTGLLVLDARMSIL